jgi:hypothetical protein
VATVAVEVERLQELLARRDELVRAIATGVAAEEWDRVMAAFDALLAAIARLEAGLPAAPPVRT